MSRRHLPMLLAVWALAAVYFTWRADRGWIPHDEGALGQSAERLLAGEVPHRDFDELYTGALTYLHAAAFRLMGVKLVALRWVLLAVALLFVPALYAIAARVASPAASAVAAVVAACWSVPLYFASMPSWYNLFLATFGTLAVLRHLETGRRRWLFAAGLCGGLSVVVKLVGLFYVAAVGLLLIYREQELTAGGPDESRPSRLFKTIPAAAAVVFGLLLGLFVAKMPGTMQVFHFLLPGLGLGVFLLWNEARLERGGFAERWRRGMRLVAPFLAGVAAPVLVFLIPFAAAGALGDLAYGVFVLPQRRIEYTAMPYPPSGAFWAGVPILLLLAGPLLVRRLMNGPLGRLAPWLRQRRAAVEAVLLVVVLALAVWVVLDGGRPRVYNRTWFSLRALVPYVTMTGTLSLALACRAGTLKPLARQQTFLLLAVCTMVSLVQFPHSGRVYLAYVVPLVPLVVLFLLEAQGGALRRVWLGVAVFYFLFAAVWLHRDPGPAPVPLALERAGLKVSPDHAESYEALIGLVEEHSAEGDYIYAGPDAPEIYFLSRRQNPTRGFFEFFELGHDDPEERRRRLFARLEDHDVDVVVIRRQPFFSYPFSRELLAQLAARYPNSQRDRRFTVYWRDE